MAPKYQPVTAAEAKAVQGPRPGSRALQDVLVQRFMGRGARSGGIYNQRRVRGSLTSWSGHAAGRAGDVMVPNTPDGKHMGDEIWLRLINAAEACGICEVIWNRQRWDGTTKQVKPYRGTNPHTDHVHWMQVVDVAAHPDTPDLRKWYEHFLFGA